MNHTEMIEEYPVTEEIIPIIRLTRDDLAAAALLTTQQARYLVDAYYQIQHYRIEAAGQVRAAAATGEPNSLVTWLADQMIALEKDIKSALNRYSQNHRPGRWAMSVYGVGPVLSAALLAHIDITKAPTVGHIWSFAGLNPEMEWKKGQKRPFNAGLKVVQWKLGQSFMKFSLRPDCIYGHIYRERKAIEQQRNEEGLFADQAKAVLERKAIGKTTEAYKAYSVGKLPPAHIDARARRYAVKLFLSAYHAVAYECHYGTPPPKPWIFTRPEHSHYISPPDWPCE